MFFFFEMNFPYSVFGERSKGMNYFVGQNKIQFSLPLKEPVAQQVIFLCMKVFLYGSLKHLASWAPFMYPVCKIF